MMRRGELSAVELAEEMLARIERHNPSLRAYITVCGDRALKEARAAQGRIEAGEPRSPIEGIPYAAKDSIATAGARTTANSALLAD